MRFQWTINDLKEKTDLEILRGLVAERQSDITNFAQRLEKIYNQLDKEIQAAREASEAWLRFPWLSPEEREEP